MPRKKRDAGRSGRLHNVDLYVALAHVNKPADSNGETCKYPRLTRCRLHPGFTLIELMAVVVLIAVVAAITTIQLRGPLQNATHNANIERLEFLEQQTRVHAQRFGRPSELIINLDSGQLASSANSAKSPEYAMSFTPRGGTRIQGVLSADGYSTAGTARIRVSDKGQTTTYVLQLQSPGNRQEWLVFVGLTGQALRVKDEIEMDQLRRFLSQTRSDAD